MIRTILATTALVCCGAAAQAATYSFAFEWDGSALSEVGTDTMAGTVLHVGDDFTVTLSAADDGYWTWNGGSSFNYPLNPRRNDGGTVGHNGTLELSLDGSSVLTNSETPGSRCCAEIGLTDINGLTAGLQYDMLALDYEILSIGSGTDVSLIGGFWNDNLWDSSNVTFTPGESAAVPLPASFGLYGGAVLLGGAVARRRKKAKAA